MSPGSTDVFALDPWCRLWRAQTPDLSPPEILEPRRRQLGVKHRVLDIAVAEIGLQAARIMPVIRELVAAGMPKHVRVRLEAKASRDVGAPDQSAEARLAKWCAALGREHYWRLRVLLALKPAQRPQFIADNRVRRRRAALVAPDVHHAGGKVDLVPTQVNQFGDPQAVAIGDQDHGGVAVAVAVAVADSLDQPLDLGLGQMLAAAQVAVGRPLLAWRAFDCPI
jgi:hypothetical protein